tara:strand:+ start:314 stop:562 length:249 start_codon:yes stop_codon:yes gene_type:complete
MTKKKADIPEAVFDYCIDNKVSIEEGLRAFIEQKLETVGNGLANLKSEVEGAIEGVEGKMSKQAMADVEDFLNFIDQQRTND